MMASLKCQKNAIKLIVTLLILFPLTSSLTSEDKKNEEGWNPKKVEDTLKCEKCNRFLNGYLCEKCKKADRKYRLSDNEVIFRKCPSCGEEVNPIKLTDKQGKCQFCGITPKQVSVWNRPVYACPSHPQQEFLQNGNCNQIITDSKGNPQKCNKNFAVKYIEMSEAVIFHKCCNEKCGYYTSLQPTSSGKCPKCGEKLTTQNTCKALLKTVFTQPPNQDRIKKAIENGMKYLIDRYQKDGFSKPLKLKKGDMSRGWEEFVSPTLAIYTLIECGAPKEHPLMKEASEYLLKTPMEKMSVINGAGAHIYAISLAIMALENLDRELYHERIADLTQFIVDSQAKNGGWGYPIPTRPKPSEHPVQTPRETIKLVKTGETREGTEVVKITTLKKGKPPLNTEFYVNHSSTQFALLALRCAERSGVEIPQQTWQDAKNYLLNIQSKDGGWGYISSAEKGYGSMTFAGIAGLIICKYYLEEKNYKEDPAIDKAMAWIKNNFYVNRNPLTELSYWSSGNDWYFYYFYCIERMMVITETESIDGIPWYPLVTEQLLSLQQENGSWNSMVLTKDQEKDKKATTEQWWSHPVIDTCFALFCLNKTTKELTKPKSQPLTKEKIEITPGGTKK